MRLVVHWPPVPMCLPGSGPPDHKNYEPGSRVEGRARRTAGCRQWCRSTGPHCGYGEGRALHTRPRARRRRNAWWRPRRCLRVDAGGDASLCHHARHGAGSGCGFPRLSASWFHTCVLPIDRPSRGGSGCGLTKLHTRVRMHFHHSQRGHAQVLKYQVSNRSHAGEKLRVSFYRLNI